ncbi:Gfo/Idh/MocA family protein [uncultured Robinsoniella sp.]|uniref:Gfo/Idh/MocA family protein n=1 Tax=uncultured Robinsoniella sp. TaxID=904190 RepID=UPI00374FBBF5
MMVKLGVIGYGVRIDMLADEFMSLLEKVQITAIADKNPERVKALLTKADSSEIMHQMEIDKIDGLWRKCPMDPDTIHFYDTAQEMLDQEELDGVLVGTNCDTHAQLAEMVMKRGIPLFLEKPVGVTREDLELLERCDREPHAPVVVSFPLRVTRMVREAKRIIDSGVIGKVEHVQAFNDVPYGFVYFHDWYRNEAVSHGMFLQKATHDVDVINYLTGEKPVQVCAMKSKQIFKGDRKAGLRCSECDCCGSCMESTYHITKTRNDIPRSDYCCYAVDTGNEDSGSLLIRYESGMHAVYSQNFFARKGAARRGARLYGYKGTLEFNFTTDEIKVYDHMSDQVSVIKIGTPPAGHGGGDYELARNFVQLIQGETTESVAPLGEGIISAKVCMAAKESSEEEVFKTVL